MGHPPLPEQARTTIADLVARMRDDEDERRRRWPEHPFLRDQSRERAHAGQLFVSVPWWFHDVSLDAHGRVVVRVEGDDGVVLERPANALEAHITWQADVARSWPELAAFVPARPMDAVVCESCGGNGLAAVGGELANVRCLCGDAGWVPPEAVGEEAFVDWPRVGGSPLAVAPVDGRSLWRRLMDWVALWAR